MADIQEVLEMGGVLVYSAYLLALLGGSFLSSYGLHLCLLLSLL